MKPFRKIFLSAFFLSGIFCNPSAQSVWIARTSGVRANAFLYSVILADNQLVAVGGDGDVGGGSIILTSPDGITWTKRSPSLPAGIFFNSVAWTGNQLVAMGTPDTILTSPNGVTWTKRNTRVIDEFRSVTWTGTQLVAAGLYGGIATSPDGVTWAAQVSGTTVHLASIVWMGNQLVAVGDNGIILTSPNGINWTVRNSGTTGNLSSIMWANNQLVAVGDVIITSPDGVTWTKRSSAVGLRSVTWTGNQFVAVGYGGNGSIVMVSPDGMTWWKIPSTPVLDNNWFISVVWSGNKLVEVGIGNRIFTSDQDSTPPPVPILKTPAQNAVGIATSTTLVWGASSGALAYRVQLSRDPTFATKIVDDSLVTDITRPVGPLVNSTVYYWRVSARNGVSISAYSATGTFTTAAPVTPSPPILMIPAQNATSVSITPTLIWHPSIDVASYRVQLSTDSTFATALINDSMVTDTTRSAGTLNYNTPYYWRVSAKNSAGTSAFSAKWHFTTVALAIPAIPVLSSPASATTVPVSLNLVWNAAARAATYRVQVSINSNFFPTVIDDSTLTGTTRTIGPLDYNTTYYWRINAKNGGGTSAYSNAYMFTTLPAPPVAPTLYAPAQDAINVSTSPTLNWLGYVGSLSYRLQFATDIDFTQLIVDDSTRTATAYATGPLPTDFTFYWRVNAKGTGGTSNWSPTFNFTTASTSATLQKKVLFHSLKIEKNESLRFVLPQREHVIIQLFNSQGQIVSQLFNGIYEAGYYTVPLFSKARGSYYLDFQAGDFHKTTKINP
jgi:hypothetical protein